MLHAFAKRSAPIAQQKSTRTAHASSHALLQMQRAVGNQATSQFLTASSAATSSAASDKQAPTGKMPPNVRTQMERAFQTSFSNVNIEPSSSQARDVGAHAFTQGQNIHFAPGMYQPDSKQGQSLLGHELAHVVQQRQGRVKQTTQAKGLPVNDDPALEHEADEMGEHAMEMIQDPAESEEEEGGADTAQNEGAAITNPAPSTPAATSSSSPSQMKRAGVIQMGRAPSLRRTRAKNGPKRRKIINRLPKSLSMYVNGGVLSARKKRSRVAKPTSSFNVKFGNLQNDCGTSMEAQLMPGDGRNHGSSPTVAPSWWDNMKAVTNGMNGNAGDWTTKNLVQGHLLNDNLGGPGNSMKNLTPITRSANSTHESQAENDIKHQSLDQGKAVHYTVNVDYSAPPSSLKPYVPNPYLGYFPKALNCNYTVYDPTKLVDQSDLTSSQNKSAIEKQSGTITIDNKL